MIPLMTQFDAKEMTELDITAQKAQENLSRANLDLKGLKTRFDSQVILFDMLYVIYF